MPHRTWRTKFSDAFRGFRHGVRGQSSFFVHFFFAAAVVGAGLALRVTLVEWCLLALCIAGVLTAEMFNTALEKLVKATVKQHNPEVGAALDISSAAVLLASIGAVVVGAIIFTPKLWAIFA
ncbi:MAG: diacylglycerol kinase [Pirellulales bacterium]